MKTKTEGGTLQPLLKKLRRHGVKSASFAAGKLVSVEFFPYQSYYVDSDGTKTKKGDDKPGEVSRQSEEARDTLTTTVLESDRLPDIEFDKTELLDNDED